MAINVEFLIFWETKKDSSEDLVNVAERKNVYQCIEVC